MKMADGYNQARALRIAEIIGDFRNLQTYVAQISVNPSAEDYNEDGYVELRRCASDAQALLAQPFQPVNGAVGDTEAQKAQLRRIITDAAVRRFKAQKIYLRATVCLRWVNSRMAILQGRRPEARDAQRLQQIRDQFRRDLSAISDDRVYQMVTASDNASGKWVAEDPNLATIQSLVRTSNGR